MSVIDPVIGLLAPHQCIACGIEGYVLCDSCLLTAGEPVPERCAGCKRLSKGYETCGQCKSWLPLKAIYVSTVYDGIYERLERAFKFDLKRQAAVPMAYIMADSLSTISPNMIVCPVPTAPARVRRRGFDHAKLLAKEFSKITNLKTEKLLARTSNVRQLGSSRSERMEQMNDEFVVKDSIAVDGKEIILLDDVTTTGATLAAAAKSLKKAGAKQVYAVVFAQKM